MIAKGSAPLPNPAMFRPEKVFGVEVPTKLRIIEMIPLREGLRVWWRNEAAEYHSFDVVDTPESKAAFAAYMRLTC